MLDVKMALLFKTISKMIFLNRQLSKKYAFQLIKCIRRYV